MPIIMSSFHNLVVWMAGLSPWVVIMLAALLGITGVVLVTHDKMLKPGVSALIIGFVWPILCQMALSTVNYTDVNLYKLDETFLLPAQYVSIYSVPESDVVISYEVNEIADYTMTKNETGYMLTVNTSDGDSTTAQVTEETGYWAEKVLKIVSGAKKTP